MKKSIIENYLDVCIMNISHKIDKRIEEYFTSYKKKQFGKGFFLDVETLNVLSDLIYYREEHLKAHLQLCRANKIPEENFAFKHALYYQKKLKDIELKSFIQIIKLKDSWFVYSEAQKEKMNKNLLIL